jgi:hypothetical protein
MEMVLGWYDGGRFFADIGALASLKHNLILFAWYLLYIYNVVPEPGIHFEKDNSLIFLF